MKVEIPGILESESSRSPVGTDYSSNEWPWTYTHWQLFPGPGVDDFRCEFATTEAAVETVLAVYFGHPTIIDNWLVPLHLHPELLSEDHVRAALSQAIAITANQFEIMEEERLNFSRRESRKEELP